MSGQAQNAWLDEVGLGAAQAVCAVARSPDSLWVWAQVQIEEERQTLSNNRSESAFSEEESEPNPADF
jgi:hypothetical protein